MKREVEWDQTNQNAADILEDLKSNGGKFREVETLWISRSSGKAVRTERWYCSCAGDKGGDRRLLARTVVGRADDIDGVFVWLWVAGHKTTSRKVPPAAVTVVDEQENHRERMRRLFPLLTICPRCRRSFVFMPGYCPNIPGMWDVPTIADGGPKALITPGVVNVLEAESGHYDRRVVER